MRELFFKYNIYDCEDDVQADLDWLCCKDWLQEYLDDSDETIFLATGENMNWQGANGWNILHNVNDAEKLIEEIVNTGVENLTVWKIENGGLEFNYKHNDCPVNGTTIYINRLDKLIEGLTEEEVDELVTEAENNYNYEIDDKLDAVRDLMEEDEDFIEKYFIKS